MSDLKKRVDDVLALQAKATPGPWQHDFNGFVAVVELDQWGESIAQPPSGIPRPYSGQVLSDMFFIAAAHTMADLLREQQAEIERLTKNAGDATSKLAEPEIDLAMDSEGGYCD